MKKIVAKVGTYQKDGQTKTRYQDIGVIQSNSNGEYVLLNPAVNLAGVLAQQNAMNGEQRTNVMCSVFDNQSQQQAAPQQQYQQQPPPQQAPQAQNRAQPMQPQQPAPQQFDNSFDDTTPF